MPRRPDIRREIKDMFMKRDLLTHDGTMNEAKIQEARIFMEAKEQTNDGSPRAEAAEDMSTVVLHRNYTAWGDIPPRYQGHILTSCEPISLGRANLKSLVRKGCKEPARASLNELREYITDIPDGQYIGEAQLSLITEFVMEKNEEKGRRARELHLPPAWQRDGHFLPEVVEEKRGVQITERWTGHSIVLEDLWAEGDDIPVVTVDMNFARLRAMLCLSGTPINSEPLYNMFIAAGFSMAVVPDTTVQQKAPKGMKRGQASKPTTAGATPLKRMPSRTSFTVSPVKPGDEDPANKRVKTELPGESKDPSAPTAAGPPDEATGGSAADAVLDDNGINDGAPPGDAAAGENPEPVAHATAAKSETNEDDYVPPQPVMAPAV